MAIVTAFAGETLDALVWRATGRGAPALEAVLAANPGLAAGAVALADGQAVTIPELAPEAAETLALVQLWD